MTDKRATPDITAKQEKIAREVAIALLRTAEIKRQVKELEEYFATISKGNK